MSVSVVAATASLTSCRMRASVSADILEVIEQNGNWGDLENPYFLARDLIAGRKSQSFMYGRTNPLNSSIVLQF